MDKLTYFQKSRELNVSNRCPILDKCSRRMDTILLMGGVRKNVKGKDGIEQLKNAGVIDDSYQKNAISNGEAAYVGDSQNCFHFNNTCPEVPLFDREFARVFIPQISSVQGDWDNFRREDRKFKNTRCAHFTECPEYSKWIMKKKNKKAKKKIVQNQSIGGLVGRMDGGKIIDSSSSGKIVIDGKSPTSVGGLVGSGKNFEIINSSSDMVITTAENEQKFNEIADVVKLQLVNDDKLTRVMEVLEDMRAHQGKSSYKDLYQELIALTANHMTIIGPYIPFLTSHL